MKGHLLLLMGVFSWVGLIAQPSGDLLVPFEADQAMQSPIIATPDTAILVNPCPVQTEIDWNDWTLFVDPRDSLIQATGTQVQFATDDPDGILASFIVDDNLLSTQSIFWVQDETVAGQSTTVTVRFSNAVEELCFTLYDVDALVGSFEDHVTIDGYSGGNKVTIQPTQYQLGSKVQYIGNNTFAGIDQVFGSTSPDGNVAICFTQELDSIQLQMGQGPMGAPNFELHHVGIANFSWCTPDNNPPFFEDSGGNPLDTMYLGAIANTSSSICLLNAVDPDMDSITLTSVTSLTASSTIDLGNPLDTCFNYIPETDFLGTELIEAVICDNGAPSLCGSVILKMNVLPGPPAQAINDTIQTAMQEAITVDVLANDINPVGAPLAVTIAANPSSGTAVVLPDNTVEYTPNPDFTGEDVFTYQICDYSGLTGAAPQCDQAEVVIEVIATNNPPVVVDEASNAVDTLFFETPLNTPRDLCLNVVDIDNDNVVVTTATSINGNSILVTAFPADTCLNYSPNPGFTGVEWLNVTVCDDGNPSLCDQVIIEMNVLPYTPAIAVDDFAKTRQGTATNIDVQANDFNPFVPKLPTTIIDGYPLNGTASVLDRDSLRYNPGADFYGVDTVSYELCDNIGVGGIPQCDQANVTVYVECRDRSALNWENFEPTVSQDQQNLEAGGIRLQFDLDNKQNDLFVESIFQNYPSLIWQRSDGGTGDQATLTFSHAVNQFCFDILDLDLSNTVFQDQLVIDAYRNGAIISLQDYDAVMNDGVQFDGDNRFTGMLDVNDLAEDGNLQVCFYQPIDSIVFTLQNALGSPSGSNQQIGFGDFSWCEVINNAPLIVENPGQEVDTLTLITEMNLPLEFCLEIEDPDGDEVFIQDIDPITANGTLELAASNTCLDYSPNFDFVGEDYFRVSGCDDRNPSLCDEVIIRIIVEGDESQLPDPSEALFISQGVSPNGDGVLDYWVIEGIERYSENQVQVFNLWGDLVFETKGYDNDQWRWNGTANMGASVGNQLLPDGTYFYIISFGGAFERMKGYIVLKK